MENSNDILNDWCHVAENKPLLQRDFNINDVVSKSKQRIVSITGIRRAGKSSVLMLIYRKLSAKKAVYANMEDNRLRFTGALDSILNSSPDTQWLLLDEITSAEKWEFWLHRINEMKTVNLVVTSSLSSLSKYPPKALRGRISYFELFPLSFSEYLSFKKIKLPKTSRDIGRVEKALDEFLLYGGFPEIVLSDDKVSILQEYLNSIISLDIAFLSNIPLRVVSDFSAQLLGTTLFSATKMENVMKSMGHKIGKNALLEMEHLFENAYLAFFVPVYSTKIKDKMLYPRKVYFGDTGFFYAATGRKNLGQLFENAVFLQLRRTCGALDEINHYKSSGSLEVDFVVRQGPKIKQLVQVCYDINNDKTKQRELKALTEAAREFGLKGKRGELVVITKDIEKQEISDGLTIVYRRLWKWLLDEGRT